jgi:hypothetical protein
MTGPARVLIVANRTAATDQLLDAVRRRAETGPAEFHLVVPATPRGLHRVVDPEDFGREEASQQLKLALARLNEVTETEVTGHVGDPDPMAAISDTMHQRQIDELIISTLPRRLSRWMHVDLPRKASGLGLPLTHVEAKRVPEDAVKGEAAA